MIDDDQAGLVQVTWLPHDDLDSSVVLQIVRTASGVAGARLARMCRSCGSDLHGKPHVIVPSDAPPVFVSVSRSGGRAVVAVTGSGPVGVDVEACRPSELAPDDLVEWVRTESLLKATGHGLTTDPDEVDDARCTIDLVAPEGFVAAVTVLTDCPTVLVVTEG